MQALLVQILVLSSDFLPNKTLNVIITLKSIKENNPNIIVIFLKLYYFNLIFSF